MNPMLESIGGCRASGLKDIIGTMANPANAANNAVMSQLRKHPFFSQAEQIAAQYGGDWNRAFEETARKNGIDPQQIVGIMKSNGLA